MMRFTTKLFILFAGVLGLAVVGTSLAVWGTQEARYNLARTELAHRSYQAHLSLSNHTYQLFKQFGDAMVIGDLDQGALETELLAAIRRDIGSIREITAAEIQLDGDDKVVKLDHLVRIETKIKALLDEYQTVLATGYPTPLVEEWGRLSRILDERVDQDFARLIQEALDRELSALIEQQTLTRVRLKFNQWLAVAIAVFGAIAASAALWWLIRDFNEPVNRLIDGAEALARGDHDHRIELGGGSELEGVAHALNRMANEIADRQAQLEAANRRLETTVSQRTNRLKQLVVTLKETEDSRKRLLADVSHELRTPLTIIRGEADIALRGADKPPDDYRAALEKCREAATHTARLVDDLLFIARHESRETRLSVHAVDLVMLLPKVIEDCRSLWGRYGVSVVFLSDLATAVVRADPDRLRQVLMILLDNGQRYGGKQVEVGLTVSSGGYRIAVRDDGPGLTVEEQARVFERFFRGDNATQRYDAGVGLGLPVAKAIIEAHDGDIAIQSKPGKGLTVSVVLPGQPTLRAVS
ncbi:MAG: HAMP domain-containing sensor histidine kinase [Candidatus Competibacteraceae bacterium]